MYLFFEPSDRHCNVYALLAAGVELNYGPIKKLFNRYSHNMSLRNDIYRPTDLTYSQLKQIGQEPPSDEILSSYRIYIVSNQSNPTELGELAQNHNYPYEILPIPIDYLPDPTTVNTTDEPNVRRLLELVIYKDSERIRELQEHLRAATHETLQEYYPRSRKKEG